MLGITNPTPATKQNYLHVFGPTDPQHEKTRILADKDEPIEGSCSWVFQDPAFQAWWNDEEQSNILWIHGDPGKGKTMIVAAAIDELSRGLIHTSQSGALAFFFCQRTDERLNSAVAIVKGLIFSLVAQYKAVVDYLQET